MNILLINHYAGSSKYGMEYRPYYMAREWVKAGHNVTIIAGSHSHIRTVNPEFSGKTMHEVVEGIHYIWVKTPPYEGNGLKRFVNMLSFVKYLYLNAKRLAKNIQPDVVIASSTYPLDIYPASKIAKASHSKLIFEVHDLWPLSPKELGNMSSYHPFIMVMQLAENAAYKRADKVVSLLPKADQHMIAHGMEPSKFEYIPNGIVVEDWENAQEKIPEEHQKIIEHFKDEGMFLIGYAGTHGLANALDYLVDAAEILKNEPIGFILVGKGPEKERLNELIRKKGLNNIKLLPAINKYAIPNFLEQMDGLYIGWNKSPLYRFGVSPNKLLDYMMAGKPIIHAIEAANDIVKENECGISLPPEDSVELAKAILELRALSSDEREKMGENGKKFVLKYHDYKYLADRFVEIMK